MGVPAFFRWLSKKYPSVVVHCREEKAKVIDGVKVPIDITQPNPNEFELDNLYLDMNGIIHPCCHPENKPAPNNEDEMMEAIFEYIDRLVAIVRPRKLLYMAIDGVAPRAKMNQQRSRRFRASKETVEKRDERAKVIAELKARGIEIASDKQETQHFDSNCITPGTEFMSRLAECLRYYIHVKMNSDAGWSQIMVILSDANVPGEGEHKIMDYIRRQRAQPNHDPNTRHCLCGADADLIMLGLATHETNFTIIREEFKPHQERPCEICGQTGHKMIECTGAPKEKEGEYDEKVPSVASEQEFIFLRLNILREYLFKELKIVNLPFEEDFERAIDDWVLMCFFVGNDFLPHLPSLEIREGAIDRLIGLWKRVLYKTKGYLTDSGHVHLDRVQLMLADLGEMEDAIFKKRKETEEMFKRRNEDRNKRQKRSNDAPAYIPAGAFAPVPLGKNVKYDILSSTAIKNERQQNFRAELSGNLINASEKKDSLESQPKDNQERTSRKRKLNEDDGQPEDSVRLWEDGWKERYYMNKFSEGAEDRNFRSRVANEYILGICWVLQYYYQGCPSWTWYFPYHYAPFASDFANIESQIINFPMDTKPFKPLEQLMAVFPAASKKFLPSSWQELMHRADSKIIDFYPNNFKIDLNGKAQAWQGVALLPFVDEKRLLDTLKTVYLNLTEDEQRRNSLGNEVLFVNKQHVSFTSLEALYEGGHDETKVHLNVSMTGGIAGLVWCDEFVVLPGNVVSSPLPRMDDCRHNETICVKFLNPQYDPSFTFPAKLLPNAKIPEPVLIPWIENNGRRFANNNEYSNTHDASAARRMLRGSLNHRHVPQQTPQVVRHDYGEASSRNRSNNAHDLNGRALPDFHHPYSSGWFPNQHMGFNQGYGQGHSIHQAGYNQYSRQGYPNNSAGYNHNNVQQFHNNMQSQYSQNHTSRPRHEAPRHQRHHPYSGRHWVHFWTLMMLFCWRCFH